MTIAVDWEVQPQTKQTKSSALKFAIIDGVEMLKIYISWKLSAHFLQ